MKKIIICLCSITVVIGLCCTAFFYNKFEERNHYIDHLIKTALEGISIENRDNIVLAISKEIYKRTNNTINRDTLGLYERYEALSLFNVTTAVSLKYNTFGIKKHSTLGPCGTMTRVLLNALWRLNIPARKLQLLNNKEGKGGGHTMVEFFSQGQWRVIAPSDSSFVWRKGTGEIATVNDIKNDEDIFRQIYNYNSNYAYLFDNPKNIRWKKFPRIVYESIRSIIGEERFNNMNTPEIYDMPRDLFFIFSFVSVIFSGVIIIVFNIKLIITKINKLSLNK